MRYKTQPGVPSENGWPMCNSNECVSVEVVPAAKKVPLRKGIVATILNAWLIYINKHVEKIQSQVWGWSPDNDVWNSNHMSGTAVDVNAPMYPWGVRRMKAATIQKFRDALKKFKGVIFWGADWGYPDEMHFQIAVPPSNPRVKELADLLEKGYLGIYGDEIPQSTPSPQGEKTMLDEIKKTFKFVKLIFEQLAGYQYDSKGEPTFSGWPCLGGRTVAEALGAIGEKLEIPGMFDVDRSSEKEK